MSRSRKINIFLAWMGFLTLGIIIFVAVVQSQMQVSAKGEDCKNELSTPVFCTPTNPPKPTRRQATKTPYRSPTSTDRPTQTVTPTVEELTATWTSTFKPTVLGVSATPRPSPSVTLVPLIPILQPTYTYIPLVLRPLGDVWVTGMEVTQSIQIYGSGSLDNTIPLLAYKKTVVRVYVQSDSFSAPWRNVTARLTVTGSGITGRVLEPSTSSPSMTIAVSPAGSHRDILSDSFNFVLDSDQTRVGDVDLSVRIYDISGRPESNIANNTGSLHIHFNPGTYKTLYAFSHGTCDSANNATPPPWSMLEPQRRYVENSFPLTQFFIVPLPGNPTPCFRTDSTARSDQRANGWALDQLDRVCPSGGCIIFTFNPIVPERGGQAGWCCGVSSLGNTVINGDTRNDANSPGDIMAQEYGHFYQSPAWHTFDPTSPYPWRDNTIGHQVGMRTSAGTYGWGLETRPSGDGDVFSYGPSPFWSSPFSYCLLLNGITGGRTVCPAGSAMAALPDSHVSEHGGSKLFSPPALDKQYPYLKITGWLLANGSAVFEPFVSVSANANLPAVPENEQGQGYHLVAYDRLDNPVTDYYFQSVVGTHESPEDSRFFLLNIPYDPAIQRIRLLKGDQVLATSTASKNAPQVTIQSSLQDQSLKGKQTIIWKGNDADGDKLTYWVDYSTDNGQTWLPLGSRIEENSLTVDFDSVPGAAQAVIKVTASDGFNTASAESATFSAPKKAPQITLSGVQDGFTSTQGQPFYVEASAFDWEDGVFTDPASFTWTSDKDGPLGTGPWISPQSLSPGQHTLTVTVRDSDGNVASAAVHVTILDARPENYSEPRGPETIYLFLAVLAGILLLGIGALIVSVRYLRSQSRASKA